MIFHLFRRTPRDAIIASLYGTIVAQARAPAFYQTTFPDSMEVAAADPVAAGKW